MNPTTTSELWWPEDLPTLQIRPMLNVLFRNGILSYVSAGLDVRVPQQRDDDNSIVSWRNYGLNSQPIARQWTTLDIGLEKLFHVEGFILQNNNDDGEHNYDALFPSLDTQDVMQRVANFEVDSLSPLAEGFHIASFPMSESWVDLPSLPECTNEKAEEEGGEEAEAAIYKMVCFATSEPFANKLLDMDEDLLTMSSTSVLEVVVSKTAKGGDSQYLPEVYKPLYLNR